MRKFEIFNNVQAPRRDMEAGEAESPKSGSITNKNRRLL